VFYLWLALLTHLVFSYSLAIRYRIQAGIAQFYALVIWLSSVYIVTLFTRFDLALLCVFLLTTIFICRVLLKQSINSLKFNRQSIYDFIPWLFFVAVLLFSVKSSFRFTHWDEFASWGANLKVFLLEKEYGSASSFNSYMESGLFITYPPVPMLSEAIFSFGGLFQESRAIFGLNILVLSTIYAISCSFFPTKKIYSFLVSFFLISAYFLVGFNLNSLMADGLLGAVFLMGIVIASKMDFSNKQEKLLLLLILFLIPLLKPIGILLVVPIILQIIVALAGLPHKKPKFFLILKELSVFLVIPFLSYISWQIRLQSADVSRYMNDFDNLKSLVSEGQIILKAFVGHMVSSTVPLPGVLSEWDYLIPIDKVSPILVFFTLFLLTLLFTLRALEWRRPLVNAIVVWILGFLVFEAGLFFSYLFFFSKYESNIVAGIDRFNSTYYFAFFGYLTLVIFDRIYIFTKHKIVFATVSVLVLSTLAPQSLINSIGHINNVTIPSTSDDPSNRDNSILRYQVESVVQKLPKDSDVKKTYFIAQDTTGLANYMFDYLLLPRQSNYRCWSIGERYRESDVWTCPGDLAKYLPGFDYLVLFIADDRFWAQNSKFLAKDSYPISRGIYEVQWQNGNFRLVNVGG
jgi:hypothetical protein